MHSPLRSVCSFKMYVFNGQTALWFTAIPYSYRVDWVWSCKPSIKASNSTWCFFLTLSCWDVGLLCLASPAVFCVGQGYPTPALSICSQEFMMWGKYLILKSLKIDGGANSKAEFLCSAGHSFPRCVAAGAIFSGSNSAKCFSSHCVCLLHPLPVHHSDQQLSQWKLSVVCWLEM